MCLDLVLECKQSVVFQIFFLCLNCSMLGTAFDRNTNSFGHCPSVGVTDSDPNLAFHDSLSGAAFFCTSVLPAIADVVVSFTLCLHPGLKQHSSVLWPVACVVSLPIDLKQNSCYLGSGLCRVLAHRSEAEFMFFGLRLVSRPCP